MIDLGVLYTDFHKEYLSTAYRVTRSRLDAQEATASMWLRAVEAIEEFRNARPASIHAWLHRILYHECVNIWRKQKTRPEVQLDLTDLPPGCHYTIQEDIDNRILVDQLLSNVSARNRQSLSRKFVKGIPYADLQERRRANRVITRIRKRLRRSSA